MKNISAVWPIVSSILSAVISALIFAVSFAAKSEEKFRTIEAKQDKIERMQDDVIEIKIKVARIDERLEFLKPKNKEGP